jgi:hypothetical protein
VLIDSTTLTGRSFPVNTTELTGAPLIVKRHSVLGDFRGSPTSEFRRSRSWARM